MEITVLAFLAVAIIAWCFCAYSATYFARCRQAREFGRDSWLFICPRCFTPNNDNCTLTNYMGQKVQGGCFECHRVEAAEQEIFIGAELPEGRFKL
jgi:hypothetical protein